MISYKVTLLVTLDSDDEEIRTFKVEAWHPIAAVDTAIEQAFQDEHVVEVASQSVE